jgi:hypothetical protein
MPLEETFGRLIPVRDDELFLYVQEGNDDEVPVYVDPDAVAVAAGEEATIGARELELLQKKKLPLHGMDMGMIVHMYHTFLEKTREGVALKGADESTKVEKFKEKYCEIFAF